MILFIYVGDSGKPVENISIISSLATTIPLHSDRCKWLCTNKYNNAVCIVLYCYHM